ncbi:MAG: geranylgeranylglycerol-phosphate geranylgeranyltransferase [Chitinophagales bacterium]
MNTSVWQALKQMLQLIRWPNLLIILLSMYFVRNFIVLPIFEAVDIGSSLNDFYFFQLVLAVVLIAGGAYIQNDLFDRENDRLNGSKGLALKSISKNELERLYKLFFIAGNILGFYVAFKAGRFQLGFIFLFATLLLIIYNRIFKRQFLFGNLIVAGLSAFVLLVVALFEMPVFELHAQRMGSLLSLLYMQLMAYSLYAFFISLIREIVKDMEDIKGDGQMGMQTMPIVLGFKTTKFVLSLLLLLLIAATLYIAWIYVSDTQYPQASYIIAAVVLPLALTAIQLFKASNAKQYRKTGIMLKFVMLTGILSMPVFYYLIQ